MSPAVAAPREWTRAHPITPAIHGFSAIVALGIAIGVSFADNGSVSGRSLASPILVVVIVVAFVLAVFIAWAEWRVNRYRVDDDTVHQKKGIVFRTHRQARLDRLQAVDVVRPLLARVFGFAELRIDVAGGGRSGVRIAYMTVADAEAMRNEVLALAAGLKAARTGSAAPVESRAAARLEASPAVASMPAPTGAPVEKGSVEDALRTDARGGVAAAQERVVYRVPGGRLVGSIVLQWSTFLVLLVGVGVAAVIVATSDDPRGATTGGGASGVIAVVTVFAALWAQVNNHANFTASISADGIRLGHGLLDTRHQTVPPGRVQALAVKQSLLWRGFDWWKVALNVAGYGERQEQDKVSTLLPVGDRRQALHAMWLVLPDLGDADPAGTVGSAMSGKGSENGFTASPARSWIFDPFQWRQRGVKATERALLIRRGLFVREFFVVPHERTQSLAIRQGPLQRALRLATIEIHSTTGPVHPVAAHLDLDDAIALVEAQARRARERRARQTPEQWMAAVGG